MTCRHCGVPLVRGGPRPMDAADVIEPTRCMKSPTELHEVRS